MTLLHLIILIVVADFALERWLEWLNSRNRTKPLAPEVADIYDTEKYRQSQAYGAAKERLSLIGSLFSFMATLAMLAFGGFGWLDAQLSAYTQHPIGLPLLYFGVLGASSSVLSLPFSVYSVFVIEERFGFNKTTVATFLADLLKGALLSAILGGALLSIFVYLYQTFTDTFWLLAWAVFMGFSLFFAMFYTSLIVPVFNKLKPLEDGTLKQAIKNYAAGVGFPLKKIMVIDGSKRSSKANAYFSGIGRTKSIVLFDTLIEKHTEPEIVAVLAHEVGHYKKKHIVQSFVLSGASMLFTLWLLHLTIDRPELSAALGAASPRLHLGLIAFSVLYSPLSVVTGLLMNVFSRKNECEADRYAAQTASGADLAAALKRLSADSLSNLTPHAWYVFFHYSHPPLRERLHNLMRS